MARKDGTLAHLPFGVAALVAAAEERMRAVAVAQGTGLRAHSPFAGATAFGDAPRLQLAVESLIQSASRLQRSGETIDVSVSVTATRWNVATGARNAHDDAADRHRPDTAARIRRRSTQRNMGGPDLRRAARRAPRRYAHRACPAGRAPCVRAVAPAPSALAALSAQAAARVPFQVGAPAPLGGTLHVPRQCREIPTSRPPARLLLGERGAVIIAPRVPMQTGGDVRPVRERGTASYIAGASPRVAAVSSIRARS